MAYDPGTLSLVETALVDGFEYHGHLDTFLLQGGVSSAELASARSIAEGRNRLRPSPASRAPKRFVVQALLTHLNSAGSSGENAIAAIITGLRRAPLPTGAKTACDAVEGLRKLIKDDKAERELQREERDCELRERERQQEKVRERETARKEQGRELLQQRFFGMTQEPDPKKRGYMLETFLPDFLDYEGFAAKGSFKNTGEQIDGAFARGNQSHLIEAKWVKDPVDGSSFGNFIYKIEGKSADTRGLFISINGYSPQALEGLKQKGELRFVCIDGAHLARCFHPGMTFDKLLATIWQHAGTTGSAYLPVSKF